MTQFNPKIYQGDRIRVKLPGYSGVSRIWIWNAEKSRYESPIRGASYFARKSGVARASKVFSTREDALAWIRGEMVEPIAANNSYCIKDLILDWKRMAWPTFRETTRIFYGKVICLFKPILDVEVEQLTPAVIDRWLMELKSPTYLNSYRPTRRTLDKEIQCLKTMVNWYREINDDTKLVSPFKKRHNQMAIIKESPHKRSTYMTEEEHQRWLSELKKASHMFYVMGLVQTRQLLRVSEVCAMKWSNLDLANRSYRVSEHVIWPRVNGLPPKIVLGTKNMSAGEVHHLPLWQDVVSALAELKKEATGDLIFNDEGQILTYRQVQNRYNRAFQKANLPYSSTHICRHTGATAFLNETGDYLALQQMGNWADLKVALHYGKILGSRAKEAVERAEKPVLKLAPDEAI